MADFVYFISMVWEEWIATIASVSLIIAGVSVPIFWLFVGFFIIGMVISAFWKGAGA